MPRQRGLLLTLCLLAAPAGLRADEIPQGDVTKYTFEKSKIFPGTVRDYRVYVPDTADDSGADGLRVDRDGRLYVATRMGIQVCDQAGRVNCIIPTPNGKVSNVCFGGENFDTLYATCGDRVYKRKVKVQGANNYQAPIKPMQPRL